MTERLMPNPYQLGQHCQTTIMHVTGNRIYAGPDFYGRKVMGFRLPEWQRPLVWTEAQMIRLIESIWRGIPIGSYSYVENDDLTTDGLLIDGQQRMYALERYFDNRFTVLGYFWNQLTRVDQRAFLVSRHFPCYIVRSSDEIFLREYYNLMNFGGTAHSN